MNQIIRPSDIDQEPGGGGGGGSLAEQVTNTDIYITMIPDICMK